MKTHKHLLAICNFQRRPHGLQVKAMVYFDPQHEDIVHQYRHGGRMSEDTVI